MFGLSRDIGIDLGTANVLVYQRGRGIVLREPSIVAINKHTREAKWFGEEARQMIGRTPTAIVTVQPMRDGVIADYTVTQQMLQHFITKVVGKRRFFKPRIIICVPSGVTSVERRAVLEAARAAGAKEAYPIEEPMAAAIGAGLNISDPEGNMVVDIGGGTTDIAVISLGGVVRSDSVRIDDAIQRFVKREYNIIIGDRTAEEIKIAVGSAHPLDDELAMEIKGRDMVDGLPRTVTVISPKIREALHEPVQHIVQRTRSVLEQTPPELAADIVNNGIWLTGGGALLRGLDQLLMKETGIPVHVAEDPLSCVAIGTGKALEQIELLSETHFDYAGMET
jgi:rod shape-determining protein MreB and related proteins